MQTVTVSSKGWVVIPAEIRKRLKIKPGDKLQIIDYGGRISLAPMSYDPLASLREQLKGQPSLLQDLLQDRAREKEREERKIWGDKRPAE